ncbi:MAG: hypothetical protein K2O69_00060 [Odoribacter sp.]|nr:hypothetical protein [Odoribacter sp.]
MELAKVVIPVYKSELNEFEYISLTRCQKMLHNYKLVIVKPRSLNLAPLLSKVGGDFEIQEFDDRFFENVSGYNELMLSAGFYERFLDSEYILICQLDAYVFRDELEMWCRKGYDYVGAPWLRKSKYHRWYYRIYWSVKKLLYGALGVKSYHDCFDKVGNGGFSLRKVKAHYDVCLTMSKTIQEYNRKNSNKRFNEDSFWGLEVPLKQPDFKIPSWQEALGFSFDVQVEECFHYSRNHLPFGVHAWNNRLDMYRAHIGELPGK